MHSLQVNRLVAQVQQVVLQQVVHQQALRRLRVRAVLRVVPPEERQVALPEELRVVLPEELRVVLPEELQVVLPEGQRVLLEEPPQRQQPAPVWQGLLARRLVRSGLRSLGPVWLALLLRL